MPTYEYEGMMRVPGVPPPGYEEWEKKTVSAGYVHTLVRCDACNGDGLRPGTREPCPTCCCTLTPGWKSIGSEFKVLYKDSSEEDFKLFGFIKPKEEK